MTPNLHWESKTGVLDLELETPTEARLLENNLAGGLENAGLGNDVREVGSDAPIRATEEQSAASAVSPGRVGRSEDEGAAANGGRNKETVLREEPNEEVREEESGKEKSQSGQPAFPQEPGPNEARALATKSAPTSETLKHGPRALELLKSFLALIRAPSHVADLPETPHENAKETLCTDTGVEAVREEGTKVAPSGQTDESKGEQKPAGEVQGKKFEILGSETQDQEEPLGESLAGRAVIKVIGIGGGGCNAVDRMVQGEQRCVLGLVIPPEKQEKLIRTGSRGQCRMDSSAPLSCTAEKRK